MGERLRILFVTARFPYPALKGDQVRAYHQLRLLGRRHDVSLLSFAERPPAAADLQHVRELCSGVAVVPLSRAAMATALVRHAASPLPWQTALFQTGAMRAAVRATLARDFDLVHVQLARMAEHVLDAPVPCVVDLIDALSLNFERRAREERGPLRPLVAAEARRMRAYERAICARAAAACVVSAVDRDAIGVPSVRVIGNGVDCEHFRVGRAARRPESLVFTGNMGYFPNVNAVAWFAREVLPQIQAEVPGATLTIAGANPSREVRALAATQRGVIVTGYVEDIRAALGAASVAVAPMRAGSGMQNKVIEAMACGTPVVATPFAMGALRARDEREVLVATDARAFAAQTVRLLRDEVLRARIATAARAFVERTHSWEQSVAELEVLYRGACGRRLSA